MKIPALTFFKEFHIAKLESREKKFILSTAPEAFNGSITTISDLWSAGAILYKLLFQKPAFEEDSIKESIASILKADFKYPFQIFGGVSKKAKDLINKLLVLDPTKRLTAKEALNHPWLTSNIQQGSVDTELFKRLAAFDPDNTLKQAMLNYLDPILIDPQELKELERAFMTFDKDGNGILTRDELREGFKHTLGNKKNFENSLDLIIEQLDINGDGKIEYSEFLAGAKEQMKVSKYRLQEAFKLFDLDQSGKITQHELAKVLGKDLVDDERWRQLLEECDANGDQQIDVDEFVALLSKIKK